MAHKVYPGLRRHSLLLLLCTFIITIILCVFVCVVDLFPYTVSRCAMSGFHVSNKDSGYVRYGTIANEMNSKNGNG